MECSEVRKKFDEYLLCRLDGCTRDMISLHLENCQECREELNLLKELNIILSEEKPVFPGDGFTAGVMDRIEMEKTEQNKFFSNRLPVLNLGASLLLAGLLTVFISIPTINGLISRCTDGIASGAAVVNTSINNRTGEIGIFLKGILDMGGK